MSLRCAASSARRCALARYHVVEVGTAREALAQAAGRNPDLILLDLGLPDGDGLEVARQVRRSARTPIIVLSARGQEQDKVAALDLGADDYLTKPFGVPNCSPASAWRSAMRPLRRARPCRYSSPASSG